MKHRVLPTIFTMLSTLFFLINGAQADDLKSRIVQRLPVIIDLKERGIVGEDNLGLLQFIGQKREQEEIVKAENIDRQQVYSVIAKQQGTTVEMVGKRRALQIADKAKTGEWLQNSDGKWHQKQ